MRRASKEFDTHGNLNETEVDELRARADTLLQDLFTLVPDLAVLARRRSPTDLKDLETVPRASEQVGRRLGDVGGREDRLGRGQAREVERV